MVKIKYETKNIYMKFIITINKYILVNLTFILVISQKKTCTFIIIYYFYCELY